MHHKGIPLLVLLEYFICVQGVPDLRTLPVSRCDGRSCNPSVGNLATGRTVSTLSSCGQNGTELYCSYPDPGLSACQRPKCGKCNTQHPGHAHRAAHMTDDFFSNPGTWWQSAAGVNREELRLDLETEFYLTHVIVRFRSPRPAAMTLERSQDYGRSWRPYKHFAVNCSETFGIPDDVSHAGSLCTSRYSHALPCTKGEVIFRALTPGSGIEDPYSAEAQDLLKLTTLRLRLLKRQDCPCRGAPVGALPKPQHSAHYAVYDLIARGSCFCNGHAEDCQPAPGTRREGSMVHGSCLCQHHTAGEHCETCAPLYNDLPWRPGDGKTGAPNECKKCQCHGHAESCHFDSGVWLASGKRSGGVCDGCRHNTKGRRCQRCQAGFYRDQAKPMSSLDACKRSTSDSFSRLWKCHPLSGYCYCKPGVAGPNCARCMMGYWGFRKSGCRPCDCARDCDPETGECLDSFDHEAFFNVPIGGRIPDLIHVPTNESEGEWTWEDEQGFSALRHPEKCICKEKMLGGVPDFCKMKYDYVIKARILSAHDKGTHAEAVVKVKKVMRQGKVKISPGNRSIYPESWTNRGCTCPVMNPGTDYLIAGHEDFRTSKLLVNMHSLVKPWKASVGKQVAEILQSGCK